LYTTADDLSNTREDTGSTEKDNEGIVQIEKEIRDIQARLPRHSVPPALLIALEDLETELAQLRAWGLGGRDRSPGPEVVQRP
jgi:hypothetical protein